MSVYKPLHRLFVVIQDIYTTHYWNTYKTSTNIYSLQTTVITVIVLSPIYKFFEDFSKQPINLLYG